MRENSLVIKFGGSQATSIEGAKADYLYGFLNSLGTSLLNSYAHIGLVIGGGPRARALQAQVKGVSQKNLVTRQVMWEHAETLADVSRSLGLSTVKDVPHSPEEMDHILRSDKARVVALSWLQDGQSSDASSISLAEIWMKEIHSAQVVILSNVAYIFTNNPNVVATARAITRSNVRQLVKEGVLTDDPRSFIPGDHVVIDPVAVSRLVRNENIAIPLYFGHGADPVNVKVFLNGMQTNKGTILNKKYVRTEYIDEK